MALSISATYMINVRLGTFCQGRNKSRLPIRLNLRMARVMRSEAPNQPTPTCVSELLQQQMEPKLGPDPDKAICRYI